MEISDVIRYLPIDIHCPVCGHSEPKTVGWLEAHEDFACLCGAILKPALLGYPEQRKQLERRFEKFLHQDPFHSSSK